MTESRSSAASMRNEWTQCSQTCCKTSSSPAKFRNDSATGKMTAITIKDIERLSDPAAPEPERTSDPSQLWDPPDTDD